MILLCWYKRYSVCLIPSFNLSELFPTFICADKIGDLVNSLFGVKIFNPSFITSSLSSSGGMLSSFSLSSISSFSSHPS